MSREEALNEELRKSQMGNAGKFDYVNVRAFDRLGIQQFKPVQGTNIIRIIDLPFSKYPIDKKPFYGREVFIHSNVGADQRTFVCTRKMWNERCAVCELIDKLRTANPNDARISELYPSRRFLFFVYDTHSQETEAKGLQWFDSPPTVKDGICGISKDPRTGKPFDISSKDTGSDVAFDKIGSGKNGTKYTAFQLVRGPTPPDSWYKNVPDDFEEFILHPRYEDVYAQVAQLGGAPAGPAQDPQNPPAPAAETRVRGEIPTGTIQDPPRQEPPAPVSQPPVATVNPPAPPAPVNQTVTPAPQSTPAPQQQPAAPQPPAVETRVRGEAPAAGAETRVRGEPGAAPATGVTSEVRNRIEQLRQQG